MLLKEDFFFLLPTFPEDGAQTPCKPRGEALGLGQEARAGTRGRAEARPLIGFSAGSARGGRGHSLGLARINNPGEL